MKAIFSLIRIAAIGIGLGLASFGHARAEQYALMVAIEDYSKVGADDLPGCIVDLNDLKKLLETQFGFPASNITVLGDEQATKAKILGALNDLVTKAKPGDSVVIYYSGHGGQVPDMNDDDEAEDNLDEALITFDFNPKDPDTWLLDDHLRASLSQLKTKRALVLLDACHSGTGTRTLQSNEKKVINKRAEFGFETMLGRGRMDKEQIETASKSGGPSTHVLLSGCAANEVSGMGEYDGVVRSLFTTALIRVLPRMTTASLADLNAALHQEMAQIDPGTAETQHPQLEASINVNISVLIGPGDGGGASAEVNEPNEELPVQRPTDGLPSAFPVAVTTDKREYQPGETMVATVVADKPGYLRLYYVDKEGDATLIFPNFYQKENRIEGRQRVEVGGEAHPFLFRMKEPGGTEILLAAVSPEPFTDDAALDFTKDKPLAAMGKATSLRQLVDRGTKEVDIEARPGGVRPVQIGRAGCIYEIKVP
jgi:hypothetical protein